NFIVSAARALTVNGDQLANHNDTITVDALGGGVRVTLNGEVAQFDPGTISSITVNNGTGNDTINVLRTLPGVPLSVNSGGATTACNIGTNNSVAGIQGPVSLENEPSFDTVNINDQGDTAAHTAVLDTVPRSGDTSLGRLQGIGAAPITWDYLDTTAVNIHFG